MSLTAWHMIRYIPVPLKLPLIFSENSFTVFSTADLSGRHSAPSWGKSDSSISGTNASTKRSESFLYQTKKNEDASNKVHQSTWPRTSTCLWSLPQVSILVKGCPQDVFVYLLLHVPILPNMKNFVCLIMWDKRIWGWPDNDATARTPYWEA